MPLTTELEQRQQAELIRLATELARKDEIIAELKQQNKSLSRRLADQRAANIELHDIAEQWRAIAEHNSAAGWLERE